MYFMDCGYLIIAFPVRCDFIIRLGLTEVSEGHFLLLIWGMSTLYFASIMVRLVLVFGPVLAFVAAFGIDWLVRPSLSRFSGYCIVVLGGLWLLCILTCYHTVWFSCFNYSGDQITFMITTSVGRESSDDYREAYRWLWCNTGRNERVMSWWDDGY
jgi:dolichyl-diphosphooligosaccharide--protein glycosyltransferase